MQNRFSFLFFLSFLRGWRFLLFPAWGVKFPSEVPMTRQFDVVVERDAEGYFVASVPALPGCHTQARSLDELMARIREAIELCL